MNIFKHYKEVVFNKIKTTDTFGNLDFKLDDCLIDVVKQKSAGGDLSLNLAFILAKLLKKKPTDIANQLVDLLATIDDFSKVEAAGPGFVNITLKKEIYYKLLLEVLGQKENYGRSDILSDYYVNVEFVSANPTGPLHLANIRGAIIGDTIANLLAFASANVTKEYYVNDAGSQVDCLVQTLEFRYKQLFDKTVTKLPDNSYPGEYLIDLAKKLKQIHGDKLLTKKSDENYQLFRDFALTNILNMIKADLARLGIKFDLFSFESKMVDDGILTKLISDFQAKGLLYRGKLPKPKKMSEHESWAEDELLLFRSSKFGDDIDRSFTKKDESYTYFAHDAAYHKNKLDRLDCSGERKILIDVLGADHSGYVKRITAASLASEPKAKFHAIVCQLVRLISDNKVVSMSKRSGDFVTISEVLDKIDKDIIRFFILSRKADAPLDIDLSQLVVESKDNVVFYVQYCCARISSLQELFIKTFGKDKVALTANLELLTNQYEIDIIKKIAYFPRLIESVAQTYELQKLTNYINELASMFHSSWAYAKDDDKLRFIISDNFDLSLARLKLSLAVLQVISNCLKIFQVVPVKKM